MCPFYPKDIWLLVSKSKFIAFCQVYCFLKTFFFCPCFYHYHLLCRMMDVSLLIIRSPLSLIHWETHFSMCYSLLYSLGFSSLRLSPFHPSFTSPSSVFDDGCRFISSCYLRGSQACDAKGPRGQQPSQTFPTRCSLNSSWETNEDEFGVWMQLITKGVLGFSQNVHLLYPDYCGRFILFGLSGFCYAFIQFLTLRATKQI